MLAFLEHLFGAYKITARQYFTTYYKDVERKGRFTGKYQHIADWEWVDGKLPDKIRGEA